MDAALRSEMANLIREVLNALYTVRSQLIEPTDGSPGNGDRKNTETRRNGEPWGTIPAETYSTLIGGLSVATVDHLHGCRQVMLDDIDFGPAVMARCTLEAAGRLSWLLDTDLDVRGRVGRGYAIRVRGLRDNVRNLTALVEAEPNPEPDLVLAAHAASLRLPEVIGTAHDLGFKTERDPETNQFTGLVGLSTLRDAQYGYEAIRHLDVPPLGLIYGQWSGMAHSTYDAIRNSVLDVNESDGLMQIGTSDASRIIAGALATIGALHALDQTIVYFGVADPSPRLALESRVLPAIKQLFFDAIGASATK